MLRRIDNGSRELPHPVGNGEREVGRSTKEAEAPVVAERREVGGRSGAGNGSGAIDVQTALEMRIPEVDRISPDGRDHVCARIQLLRVRTMCRAQYRPGEHQVADT
jgi:hypothetical protein